MSEGGIVPVSCIEAKNLPTCTKLAFTGSIGVARVMVHTTEQQNAHSRQGCELAQTWGNGPVKMQPSDGPKGKWDRKWLHLGV